MRLIALFCAFIRFGRVSKARWLFARLCWPCEPSEVSPLEQQSIWQWFYGYHFFWCSLLVCWPPSCTHRCVLVFSRAHSCRLRRPLPPSCERRPAALSVRVRLLSSDDVIPPGCRFSARLFFALHCIARALSPSTDSNLRSFVKMFTSDNLL